MTLGANAQTDTFRHRLALILGAAKGPVFGDMLGTLRVELAGPESIMRAENDAAGWCASELLRAHGESLLKQAGGGTQARAEALFARSLDLARQQGALAWEIRTAVSLARLWNEQGRGKSGRALLASVYRQFSEGFQTADLVAAKQLLDGMGCDVEPGLTR
jgi:predicted ATPase